MGAERSRIQVKICGVTRADDAAVAAAAGASYLGVIFASGPRLLTLQRAAEVQRGAAGVPVLGVFGSQTTGEILRARDAAGLAGAQLHGAYEAEVGRQLQAEGLIVWRVVRLQRAEELERVAEAIRGADAVLVEPRVAGGEGGAGVSLSVDLARAARARLRDALMVLAGGLTSDNVGAAIAAVKPDIVDVSSGVEQSPGVKDRSLIARFMEAVVGYHPAR